MKIKNNMARVFVVGFPLQADMAVVTPIFCLPDATLEVPDAHWANMKDKKDIAHLLAEGDIEEVVSPEPKKLSVK